MKANLANYLFVIIGMFVCGTPLSAQTVKAETIPAEYQTITRKILIHADSVIEIKEPAQFETITKQVLVKHYHDTEWKMIENQAEMILFCKQCADNRKNKHIK